MAGDSKTDSESIENEMKQNCEQSPKQIVSYTLKAQGAKLVLSGGSSHRCMRSPPPLQLDSRLNPDRDYR